jgi:deoxyribodipyrimidine photo-lyase
MNDICPERQRGGYENGLKTLESFLNERGENYRVEMSSPIFGRESCSRLSTFLSTGTISMREAAQSLWSRQRELKVMASEGEETGMWRGSMSSFNGRLHWHCHFMQKLEDEPEQELENIHPFYAGLRPRASEDAQTAARLKAWSEGRTGFPFVDACMRSLNATGWINFRMRAMLMSFASYHLWLDWRDSGLLYAQKFTDYEPGIHWPQVQMQSGTTGINTVRMYNPVKQGYDQDPEGSFTRKWVPELADIPDPFLQEPWKWPDPKETIPTRYPARVIDHVKAGKEARDKIYAVRRRDGHRDIAKAIAAKHGSRKRR